MGTILRIALRNLRAKAPPKRLAPDARVGEVRISTDTCCVASGAA